MRRFPFPALALAFLALSAWAFDPGSVDALLPGMKAATFTAQRRAALEPTEVRAWRDARDVRKVEVIEDADGRKRITRYYYQGEGVLAAWVDDAGRLTEATGDRPATAEAAERSAAAAFYRDAARLAFEKQARAEQRSLCSDRETAVFACRMGPKLASICASKDAAPGRGTLQLRVGVAGSRLPHEIAAPDPSLPPSRAATGENVAFSGGGGSWLRLAAGELAYVAYSGVGRWGPHGETREKQGLVVERGGQVVSHVRCTERYETLPDRDWYEAMGIAAGDGGDFQFPD